MALLGAAIGGYIGFLMRPSAFVVGQLPFDIVIQRGSNLSGLDSLLVSTAQQSFNVMMTGAALGVAAGLVVGVLLRKGGRQ